MKTIIIALCVLGAVLAEEKYESLNDDFDISEVLQNDRLLTAYSKCLLDKGPCTPEVKKIKDKLPEALETHCAKCTDKQRQLGKQLAQGIKSKHPEIWSELVTFYDPQGKHQKAFQDFLKS